MLRLSFPDRDQVSGSFAALVVGGLQKGLVLHVPATRSDVIEPAFDGPLVHNDSPQSYALSEGFLQDCCERGIRQPVCTPSGGGEKYEHALLDLSDMIEDNTPYLRIVFVKPSQRQEYRNRYPSLLLCELPSDDGHVGDARFWIKAFCARMLDDGMKRDAAHSRVFFKRFLMLDDDVSCFFDDKDMPVPLNKMINDTELMDRLTADEPPAIVGFHCRNPARKPGACPFVVNGATAPGMAVVIVRTSVPTQYYPHATHAEDSDFDHRCRANALHEPAPTIKCNRFRYSVIGSGNVHGADRVRDLFATRLGNALKASGLDPERNVQVVGTYPLRKSFHPWTYRQEHFAQTTFVIIRPRALIDHRMRLLQAVFLRVTPSLSVPASCPLRE